MLPAVCVRLLLTGAGMGRSVEQSGEWHDDSGPFPLATKSGGGSGTQGGQEMIL